MNSPRHHNLGISAHIDTGKTTITERIIGIMRRTREEQEAKEKIAPKGPTTGERITAKLISKILT